MQYRKLCLKYHPDKNSPSDAERASQAFTAITAAYHTLTTVISTKKMVEKFLDPTHAKFIDVLSLALKGQIRRNRAINASQRRIQTTPKFWNRL